MTDINLIVQYFSVRNGNSIEVRQKEIIDTLIINARNKFIDKIHLFVEGKDTDVSFLTEFSHITLIFTEDRLTYSQVFDYYNANLKNTICILANADIYFDDSLKYLNHIDWTLNLFVCPTRFEHEFHRDGNVLYGLETDLSRESRWIEPFVESIYSQDCWIWCNDIIKVDDCNFGLGIVGCDNLIARRLFDNGYNLVKCSRYITVNHYDHLSRNPQSLIKGGQSSVREKRLGQYSDYLFLGKCDTFPDKYVSKIFNVRRNYDFWSYRTLDLDVTTSLSPLMNLLLPCQISTSSHELCHTGFNACLNGQTYWEASATDKSPTITLRFHHAIRIYCMDVQGTPYIHNNIEPISYPKKLHISFSENGISFTRARVYDAICVSNYDHITRIYLYGVIASCIRIKIIDFVNKPVLRFEVYFDKYSYIDFIDKQSLSFRKFVLASQATKLHREYLTLDGLYRCKIPEMYHRHPAPWRTHLDLNMYSDFFNTNKIDGRKFWKDYIDKFLTFPESRRFNINGSSIREGISIVTSVMNRTSNISSYLDSWLIPEVDEIIVVDWSTSEPFYDIIKSKLDNRIVYVRVENEAFFIRTYAQNLGVDFCRFNKVLKLDSDISLHPDFFTVNTFSKGEFLCGNCISARDENERYTHGNVFFNIDDFYKINGYNEIITSYGHDDSDFSLRLQLHAGLNQGFIDMDTYYHNPHTETMRTINLNKVNSSRLETETNRMYVEKLPLWNNAFPRQQFNIRKKQFNYFSCNRNQNIKSM